MQLLSFHCIHMATKLVIVIHFLAILGALTIRDSDSKAVCIEEEKQALVSFKQDLVDLRNVLSSWVPEEEEDCCKWDRIVCDNITGHILELNLFGASLSGKISPSLLNLKHLTRFDLSVNNFEGIQIPSFLGSLVSLRFLDLKYSGSFVGMIPRQLGNLSNLQYFGISSYGNKDLYSNNLDWTSGLSSLEYLDMSYVNLSEASDQWLLALNKLPRLLELRLYSCELHSSIHLPSNVNFTSLRVLHLSYNTLLEGPVLFGFIKNMTHLRSLDMSGTHFGPTIPSFLYSFPKLQHLNLYRCGLQGVIPSNIVNMTSIVSLDLSMNSLKGNLPMSMGNLCDLERLVLSDNKHIGSLSEAFESLLSGCLSKRLNSLNLDNNAFSGHISDRIVEFKNLSSLVLARNNISGPIPVSLGSLATLKDLDISSNFLQGVVSEAHFANLTSLDELLASGNSLTLRVSPDWTPPFQLFSLDLSSWNLGPRFPLWLKSQKNIWIMELSNTGISGTIPNWLWNLSESFDTLNLSRNRLHGAIPDLPISSILDLSSNELTGPLPRISSSLEWLDLSNNSFSGDIYGLLCNPIDNDYALGIELIILKLRGNLLVGEIPDCWVNLASLGVIDLGNNNLIGEIPMSIGLLQNLESLHLHNNSLTGEIPKSLQNCSWLVGLDLGLNKLFGSVPRWMGNMSSLMVLNLRSNNLNGHLPFELCALVTLQILDVAHNNLSGTIPRCFENFKAMTKTNPKENGIFLSGYHFNQEAKESTVVATKGTAYLYEEILHLMSGLDLSSNKFSGEIPKELVSLRALKSLNLSGNDLHGRIPNKIGNMSELESLDLSRNRLSGEIPESMSDLNFLNYLNLSYNNLSGEIPKSTQLQSLTSFSFTGNELLCGDPLPKKCKEDNNGTENNQIVEDDDDDDGDEEFWFRLGIGMGFGISIVGVIAPLVLFKIWRRAYFWFFQEYVWYNILDGITRIKYKIGISTHSPLR